MEAARAEASGSTPPPDLPEPPSARGPGGGRARRVMIASAAVLALCGLAAAALLQNRDVTPEAADPTRQPGVEQSAPADGTDLDSRDTDQLALTARELFPGRTLVTSDGQPAYQVLRTQSSGSCAVAVTGEIVDLLDRLGCNQVVRATLRSPDGQHVLTAGLFNLTDVASAERARDRIRQMLDDRSGRFRGMAAGPDTETAARAAARVGWQVRGHYLAYCVVARADGARISANDPRAREILYDVIELYLNRTVLERRATAGVAGQPAAESADGTREDSGGRETAGN